VYARGPIRDRAPFASTPPAAGSGTSAPLPGHTPHTLNKKSCYHKLRSYLNFFFFFFTPYKVINFLPPLFLFSLLLFFSARAELSTGLLGPQVTQ